MKNKKLKFCFILFLLLSPLFSQEKANALKFYNEEKYEEAVQVCLQELDATPNKTDAFSVLGWSLLKLERYQDALEYAEQGLKVARYDSRIIEIKGEALYYLNRIEEALDYFEQYNSFSAEKFRVHEVYALMGECFIKLGQYHNADIALSKAVYGLPVIASWWARLGYAREKSGYFQWSLSAYDRALELNPSLDDALRGKERVQEFLNNP